MSLLTKYMSMHLKTRMQYRVSFFFTLVTQLITLLVEVFVLKSMFEKFNLLNTYNIYELYFNFSVIWLGYSLAQMLGRGFDKFTNLIIDGSFDLLLIRPRSLYVQIIGSDFYYEKITRVLSSLVLFVIGASKIIVEFNIFKVFVLLLIILASFFMIMSVFIIGATFCFYTIQGIEFINIFTDGTKHIGQYPMGIFYKSVRNIFTFVIPLTMVSYYPIEYLTGRTNNILMGLYPIVAILYIIPAIFIFKLGLKKYKSSGS